MRERPIPLAGPVAFLPPYQPQIKGRIEADAPLCPRCYSAPWNSDHDCRFKPAQPA
jgi:hypothetical protein